MGSSRRQTKEVAVTWRSRSKRGRAPSIGSWQQPFGCPDGGANRSPPFGWESIKQSSKQLVLCVSKRADELLVRKSESRQERPARSKPIYGRRVGQPSGYSTAVAGKRRRSSDWTEMFDASVTSFRLPVRARQRTDMSSSTQKATSPKKSKERGGRRLKRVMSRRLDATGM